MEKLDRTCSICLNDHKQPKLLTCLHVYCCQCLFDYVNKSLQDGQFPCPLCRVQIQLPSGGVEEFNDDVSSIDDVVDTNTETYDVSNMNDVAALTSYVGLCDLCESQTIVKYRCKDCKQNICDVCKKSHGKIPVTKNHEIIDFVDGFKEKEISESSNHGHQNQQTNDTPVDLCPFHTFKPIEIHCVECKTCVCLHCYVDESNRGVHNEHQILNLDKKETQTKLRDDLKGLNINLQAQIDRLQEFSDHLTSKLSEIDICSEEACNKVDQQVQLISKLVQSRAEQIKTQINKTRHEESNQLDILREDSEIAITELKSDIIESLITLEGESVVKIVERNERNRNDEMKVKQKDLVIPDLQFLGFLSESDIAHEVYTLVWELENFRKPNFTMEFNINTISSNADKYQNRYFNVGEFRWMVRVYYEDGETLGVYLFKTSDNKTSNNKTSDNKTSNNKKVKVGYSFTILNKVAGEFRTGGNETYEFEAGDSEGYGNGDFIDLEELQNPRKGFVDKEGNFSIRILIHELKDT